MIAEAIPTATKLLFMLIALGMITPALWNLVRSTTVQQRDKRYDRQRTRRNRPVGHHRYNRLWVVDHELDEVTHRPANADPEGR